MDAFIIRGLFQVETHQLLRFAKKQLKIHRRKIDVVPDDDFVVIDENGKPCFNYDDTFTVFFKDTIKVWQYDQLEYWDNDRISKTFVNAVELLSEDYNPNMHISIETDPIYNACVAVKGQIDFFYVRKGIKFRLWKEYTLEEKDIAKYSEWFIADGKLIDWKNPEIFKYSATDLDCPKLLYFESFDDF